MPRLATRFRACPICRTSLPRPCMAAHLRRPHYTCLDCTRTFGQHAWQSHVYETGHMGSIPYEPNDLAGHATTPSSSPSRETPCYDPAVFPSRAGQAPARAAAGHPPRSRHRVQRCSCGCGMVISSTSLQAQPAPARERRRPPLLTRCSCGQMIPRSYGTHRAREVNIGCPRRLSPAPDYCEPPLSATNDSQYIVGNPFAVPFPAISCPALVSGSTIYFGAVPASLRTAEAEADAGVAGADAADAAGAAREPAPANENGTGFEFSDTDEDAGFAIPGCPTNSPVAAEAIYDPPPPYRPRTHQRREPLQPMPLIVVDDGYMEAFAYTGAAPTGYIPGFIMQPALLGASEVPANGW